jgi:hypothetical protein
LKRGQAERCPFSEIDEMKAAMAARVVGHVADGRALTFDPERAAEAGDQTGVRAAGRGLEVARAKRQETRQITKAVIAGHGAGGARTMIPRVWALSAQAGEGVQFSS